jgi:hypothetical protein
VSWLGSTMFQGILQVYGQRTTQVIFMVTMSIYCGSIRRRIRSPDRLHRRFVREQLCNRNAAVQAAATYFYSSRQQHLGNCGAVTFSQSLRHSKKKPMAHTTSRAPACPLLAVNRSVKKTVEPAKRKPIRANVDSREARTPDLQCVRLT